MPQANPNGQSLRCQNDTVRLTERERTIMDDIRQSFGRQGLTRPRDGRILGGVFAGLGRRVGLDPWPARMVFLLLLLIIPGSQILLYPLLWVLMPAEDAPALTGPTFSAPPAAA
jgi:phage shock protein C